MRTGSSSLARFCGGMGVGAASVLSPVYISEVAPANIRGRLSTMQQSHDHHRPDRRLPRQLRAGAGRRRVDQQFWGGIPAWRWMFWMQADPRGDLPVALLFIPESPRYLVAKGRRGAAAGRAAHACSAGGWTARSGRRSAPASPSPPPEPADLIDKARGGVRPIVWAASAWRCSSNWSASTSSSTTARCCGSRWVHRRRRAEHQHRLRRDVDPGLLRHGGAGRQIGRKPLLLIGSAGMAATLSAWPTPSGTATWWTARCDCHRSSARWRSSAPISTSSSSTSVGAR